MALIEMIEKLSGEIGIEMTKIDADKSYALAFNPDTTLRIAELKIGFSLFSKAAACPGKKREDLFIYLMRANFLGQGTGGSRIGLDADEKVLTLSHGFPYEMNYRAFKENVEDFVNFAMYWRDEIAKFEQES